MENFEKYEKAGMILDKNGFDDISSDPLPNPLRPKIEKPG
jgi:hypothetical protein